MPADDLALVGLLSLVTASAAFTISEAVVFADVRKWAAARSGRLGELLACGYCVGHWVAFVLEGVYRPRLFHAWWPLDCFLTALVIAWLAAFQWAVLCWLLQRSGK